MKNFNKTKQYFIFDNSFYDQETGELISPIQTQNYTIVQVVESYYINAFCTKEHLQYCDLEITFPTTNSLSCSTNGKSEKLRKHEAYLSFKGDKHELSSRYGCRFQTLAVNFTSPESQELFRAVKERFDRDKKRYSPDLGHFFTAILSEFFNKQPLFSQSLDSLITSTLVRLGRTENTQSVFALSAQITPSDVLQYIDEHFLDICSLEELSTQFDYTYAHICKIFKKEFNLTPVAYLLRKKMEYTALLLSQGKTLTEIAEVTGYSTPYNLSRAFKQHFGITPNDFKRKKTQRTNSK